MTLIEWRKEFETGVAEVDYEHQELVDLINELHAQLGTDASRETVSNFLGEVFALLFIVDPAIDDLDAEIGL